MKTSRCNCVANRTRAKPAQPPVRNTGTAALAHRIGGFAKRALYLGLVLVIPGALVLVTAWHLVNSWRHGTNPIAEARRMFQLGMQGVIKEST